MAACLLGSACRADLASDPEPDDLWASPANGSDVAPSDPGTSRPVEGGSDADAGPRADSGPAPRNDERCPGQAWSLSDLLATAEPPQAVRLTAVATSQKFLVYQSASNGSCLWGAFVGSAGVPEPGDGPPPGLMLVSFGEPAQLGAGTDASCPAGTDALPDDLTPGDELDVVGRAEDFVPFACADVAPQRQLVVPTGCPVERRGRVVPLEPLTVSASLATELGRAADRELVRRYAGSLVTLTDVSLRAEEPEQWVAPYGRLQFAETALEASSKIYYSDLAPPGVKDPSKSPRFSRETRFASVTGLVMLDYCTWSLAPRDKCRDLSPPSEDCL